MTMEHKEMILDSQTYFQTSSNTNDLCFTTLETRRIKYTQTNKHQFLKVQKMSKD
jgi:hypothetical protein